MSSKGAAKSRLVVRGDYQRFDELKDCDFESATKTKLEEEKSDDYYEATYDVEAHISMYGPDSDVYDKDLANDTPTSESDRTTTHAPSTAAAPSPTENLGRKLYSPVVNRAALMTIMALEVVPKMFVFICDVKGAFLYADLYENEYIHVRPPPN